MPKGAPGQPKSLAHRHNISEALKKKGIRPPVGDKQARYAKTSQSLKAYYAKPENKAKLDAMRKLPRANKGIYSQAYWRKKAISLLGDRCQICGNCKDINLHHKDFNHSNNDPTNWQILCRKCHSRVHKRYLNWLVPALDALSETLNGFGGIEEDKDLIFCVFRQKLLNKYD